MCQTQRTQNASNVPQNSKREKPVADYKDNEETDGTTKGGTIVGFAGSTADAFTLLERLEGKLDEYPG